MNCHFDLFRKKTVILFDDGQIICLVLRLLMSSSDYLICPRPFTAGLRAAAGD
jgi:hypothetical protein